MPGHGEDNNPDYMDMDKVIGYYKDNTKEKAISMS